MLFTHCSITSRDSGIMKHCLFALAIQQGYVVALALAVYSNQLLIGIEFFKRREIKEAGR